MKKYLFSFIALLVMFMAPNTVFASSANVSVSASNTVMLGNTVKVTVNLTSSSLIGSWQVDLNYDKNYLQLTNSSAEGGGTYMVNVSSTGTKSKSYTFTFKTLKSGNAKVSIGSAMLVDYNSMDNMSVSKGSKTISIKTKAEIEASYSDNANLKSLSVGNYELTPAFDKSTLEYTVEVENDVETVNISATKADSNASVSGTGDVTLLEGSNKFEVVVTAQKGNTQKYVLNIIRKELSPIPVKLDGKEYILVRNVKALSEFVGFENTTVTYEDVEIPALKNTTIDYTIVGVKDDDGNVKMYKFENGEITDEYIELKNGNSIITPLKLIEKDVFEKAYELSDLASSVKTNTSKSDKDYTINKNYKIIYALDIVTGIKNYYLYNNKDGSFMIYDGSIEKLYEGKIEKYKYVIYGLVGLCAFFLLIIIFRRPKNKADKLARKEEKKRLKEEKRNAKELIEEQETLEENEETEEVEEETEEDVSEDAKEYLEEKEELVKTAKVPIESERKEELEIEEEVEEEKPQKKTKEQKKIEKEEAKRKKKEEKTAKKKTNEFDW